ncbi:MAG: hypothetical protein E6J08_05580 [Chloroflexi bacterium]|nr:MAG: hypothetical protein E6J08_05580 [Chloroflexota bacterium]
MRRLFTFCTVLAQIATLAVAVPGSSASQVHAAAMPVHALQAAPKPTREIFGYALGSSLGNAEWGYPSWNFSLLSTVAYFGIHINASGVMIDDSGWQTWNSSVATAFINTSHSNGVKVLMTIVLQDFSPGTPTMCSGLVNRDTTVLQAVRAMRSRGADGISVDYEGLNGTCPNGLTARDMMTSLVAQLRASLGTGAYLSVATYGSSAIDSIGFFDVNAMSPYVDSFFVMAYDLEYSNYYRAPLNCPTFCMGPTAALTAYYWNDATVMSQYLAVVPASKVILGVPYYGRKACVATLSPNAVTTSSTVPDTYLDALSEQNDPSVRSGSYAAHRDVYDTTGVERWDTWYNSSLGCTRELYFDDAASIGKKYDLVNQDGLRGAGVWTLNYGGGASELWAAMSSHFATCSSVGVNTSVGTPQPTGAQVRLTAAASGCATPLYEFWLLPPGGTWTLAQPYSTTAIFSWNTAGKAAGTYRFSVWARNSGSTSSYDSFSAFDYTLTPTCPTVTATAAPATTASLGTVATISAAATGCPNPRYEFWMKSPAGVWSLVQPYSTSPTYRLVTTGADTGAYRFSVWVRDATSPNAYDGFSAFDYTLSIQPCAATSASPSPASSAPAGTPVVITASYSSCTNPQYEFWVQSPGAGWSLAQAYSPSNTLKWSTAGRSPGSYRFSVWTRDLSSPGTYGTAPNTYDSFTAFQYTLTHVCTAVTVSQAPATSAKAGTVVTITAAASGCGNPQYELWYLPPGGTWTLARGYASGGTFMWSTGGSPAGSYRFSVWARDASSPGTGGTPPATYDAFSAFAYSLT